MIVCIDVAWIHHRQTQWYEIWHFAICLSPINVFSRRFLVPHLRFFPTPTWLSSLRPGNAAGPERLSLKPSHLRDAAAGAGTARATASTGASRSRLLQCPQATQRDAQCRGPPVSTTTASHPVFLLRLPSRDLHTRHLHTRQRKKGKEMVIQTFQMIEGKCESLLHRFSSYQAIVL